MKTGIVIITFNIDSRVFIMQIEAIRKLCTDDFTIEIIDNSTNVRMAEAIKYHAELLELNYRKTFANTKDASNSHSFAANLSFHFLKDNYDIFFYLDHDCIPVKQFSCNDILGEKVIAGLGQEKIKKYFWPGCFMLRSSIDKSLVDFSTNQELKLDTGGNLYKLIENYGEGNCKFFSESYKQNSQYSGSKHNYFSVINEIFWHCIAASNWMDLPDNDQRINTFLNAVNDEING